MAVSNLTLYQACRSHILQHHRESLLVANRSTVHKLRNAGLGVICVDHYSPLMTGIFKQNSGSLCIPVGSSFDILIDHRQIQTLADRLRLCPWQVLESALIHEYAHSFLAVTLPEYADSEPAAWVVAAAARSQCETVSNSAFQVLANHCLRK